MDKSEERQWERQRLNADLEEYDRQLKFHQESIIEILGRIEKAKDRLEELTKELAGNFG